MVHFVNIAAVAMAQVTAPPGSGWQGVSYGKIGLACGICAVISVIIGAALQAGIFHKFQKHTPGTWRTEGAHQFMCSTAGRVLGGLAFPFLRFLDAVLFAQAFANFAQHRVR